MSTLQFSQADNGKFVTLNQGNMLSIRLPENPTTGYRWEIDQTPSNSSKANDIMTLETNRFVSASSTGIGGGGERTFVFKAVNVGATQLQIKLWQPWEGEPSIIDRYHLTLQVHG